MTFPLGEPACDQIFRAFQKDEADIVPPIHEDIAIGALERGAGDDGVLAGLANPLDLGGDRSQPRPAVFVGQGLAGTHFDDIARWMKLVGVFEGPVEAFGELVRDGRLAGAGHAHYHKRARYFADTIAHENSPEGPPCRQARWSRQGNARGWRAGSRPPARASRSGACLRLRPRTAFRATRQVPAR